VVAMEREADPARAIQQPPYQLWVRGFRQHEEPLRATQRGAIQNHPRRAPSGRAVRTGETRLVSHSA
jgi:hypothetical protein